MKDLTERLQKAINEYKGKNAKTKCEKLTNDLIDVISEALVDKTNDLKDYIKELKNDSLNFVNYNYEIKDGIIYLPLINNKIIDLIKLCTTLTDNEIITLNNNLDKKGITLNLEKGKENISININSFGLDASNYENTYLEFNKLYEEKLHPIIVKDVLLKILHIVKEESNSLERNSFDRANINIDIEKKDNLLFKAEKLKTHNLNSLELLISNINIEYKGFEIQKLVNELAKYHIILAAINTENDCNPYFKLFYVFDEHELNRIKKKEKLYNFNLKKASILYIDNNVELTGPYNYDNFLELSKENKTSPIINYIFKSIKKRTVCLDNDMINILLITLMNKNINKQNKYFKLDLLINGINTTTYGYISVNPTTLMPILHINKMPCKLSPTFFEIKANNKEEIQAESIEPIKYEIKNITISNKPFAKTKYPYSITTNYDKTIESSDSHQKFLLSFWLPKYKDAFNINERRITQFIYYTLINNLDSLAKNGYMQYSTDLTATLNYDNYDKISIKLNISNNELDDKNIDILINYLNIAGFIYEGYNKNTCLEINLSYIPDINKLLAYLEKEKYDIRNNPETILKGLNNIGSIIPKSNRISKKVIKKHI